jgi:aminoglycoside phosphotransferase (APT) family kinase protein
VAFTDLILRMTGRRRPSTRHGQRSAHATLAHSLVEDFSARIGQRCSLLDCRATRTGSLTCRLRGDRLYVAKLPLRPSTESRLRLNAETLSALGRVDWVTPYLSARFPAIVHLGTISGYFYSVETAVAGHDGAALLKADGAVEDMILDTAHFLAQLHKASMVDSRSRAWEGPFESWVGEVRELAVRAGCAPTYDQLIADIRSRLAAQPVASVFSHGNLWLGNVLFDASRRLTGVIDWDCASAAALPALDLIYLLVRTHGLARSASVGEAVADWIDAGPVPFLDRCIARYCRELSIPAGLIATLSYGCWIQHLEPHCRFATRASTDRRWLQRNVADVVLRWRQRTDAVNRAERRWVIAA